MSAPTMTHELWFAADLHLHPTIWNGLQEVRNDAHNSWEQIVAAALARSPKPAALILGGDVFDRHPPSETVRCFLEGVWKLRDAGIPILAIQGQHGRSNQLPWSSLDPYVIDLNHDYAREFGPFVITGIDNMPPAQLKEALAHLHHKINVLVVHQMIRGMVPKFGDREIWDMDPDWVPSHVKLVLAGDYHSPVEREFHGTKYKYNGSTVLRSVDEPNDKFYHIIRPDFSIEAVPLNTRKVKKLVVMQEKLSDEEKASLAGTLKGQVDGTVVSVKYNPKLPCFESFCKEANPKLYYLLRPITIHEERVSPDSVPTERLNLRGCLDRLLAREKDPVLYDFLVDMLASETPAETMAEHKKKILEVLDANVQAAAGGELLSAPKAGS